MAKTKSKSKGKKSADREFVWLQCTESNDLNYRTSLRVKGGIADKMKAGLKKYCPRLRKHTLHKIKRK
jgi:large subunit ribosomal protein L33